MGPLVTLAISPAVNYDPINLIKVLILATVGLSCLGIFLGEFKSAISALPRIFVLLVALLTASLFISLLFSGAPLSQQLWGSFGRNTGLLTYVSLISIMLAATMVRVTKFTEKIVWSLVFTNVPLSLYCLIQIAKLDPIGWSAFQPFGTLGNVNFLSAFLGMSSTATLLLVFDFKSKLNNRLWLLLLTALNIFIIVKSQSIQGLIVFAAGLAVGGFFLVKAQSARRAWFLSIYSGVVLIAFINFVLALTNNGPLAKYIYQQTLIFRFDYMRAAVEMMREKPLTGVGLDSYGDFYRAERDVYAAFRTSLNRVSNSAHNIFLDIGSNAGILAFVSYVGFVVFVGLLSTRRLLIAKSLDVFHIALFSVWVGYLVQSLASINQVGVGVWGWMLTGTLLGHLLIVPEDKKNLPDLKLRNRKKGTTKNQLTPLPAVLGFVGMILGFSMAAIPAYADMQYQTGNAKLNLTLLMEASKLPGSTAIHLGKTLEIANENKFFFQAKAINELLIQRFPREIYGWTVRRTLDNPSQDIFNAASAQLEKLDPFAAICLKPDAQTNFLQLFQKLSPKDQREIVRYWGLPTEAFANPEIPFAQMTPQLQARLIGFCQ